MVTKKTLTLSGALAAIVFALAGPALAKQAPATIRIEGRTRTLLTTTVVHTHAGSITKGGAPPGACPAKSSQGALDVATRHHWSGKWFGSLNAYEIFTILGDFESGTHYFWEILVNNVPATLGACEITPRPGEQLLFAAIPVSGTADPIGLTAPRTATAGRPFDVKVVSYNPKGKSKPLAGATVKLGSERASTNGAGVAQLTAVHIGMFTVSATKAGHIRDEASVHVMGSA
jgi:hypothetical protein